MSMKDFLDAIFGTETMGVEDFARNAFGNVGVAKVHTHPSGAKEIKVQPYGLGDDENLGKRAIDTVRAFPDERIISVTWENRNGNTNGLVPNGGAYKRREIAKFYDLLGWHEEAEGERQFADDLETAGYR